ncbi:MAG: 16S rRNA (adenine(1518)-N(6)/adenine(1519)-N(6))-dimethyltransferase RsmA [Phycisphaerae bacterium]
MHTKQQIQNFLREAGFSPNHRRGQNFLIDLNLIRVLLGLANISKNDVVLEVGPGTGSLTEELVKLAGKVITVEIEQILAQITSRQLADAENLQIITTDVLQSKNTIDAVVIEAIEQAKKQFSGRFMLVANLPYSVACPVMLNLVTNTLTADCMYVTVQKEVAQRMAAEPREEEYGTISILLAATGDVKIERILKPTVFWPEPQVDSAMVSYIRNDNKVRRIHNMRMLTEVVSLFMGHRRKMLKACAKLATDDLAKVRNWSAVFQECFVDPHLRPEQLEVTDYVAIANICAEQLKSSLS